MLKIQKRNIVTAVLLSIVTCGIYGIIWVVRMIKEAVSVKDENDSAVVEILLAIFIPFVGFYLAEKKFSEGCQMRCIPHKDNSILYLILGLVGLSVVDYILLQNDLNLLVDSGYAYDPANAQPQYQSPYQPPQQPPYEPAPQPEYYQAPDQQGPQE